ncbi:MAG: short-chain dehydrogenase, partial [Casimicrobiaceae bacterium]
MELSGSVVAITGATGNLGRAVAATFEARGSTLALFGRTEASLATVYGAATARRMHVAADLLDRSAVAHGIATVIEG